MDKAAQARAIEEGGGSDGAVKKAYIRHRIARIKADRQLAKLKFESDKEKETKEAEERVASYQLKQKQRDEVKINELDPHYIENAVALRALIWIAFFISGVVILIIFS